MKMTLIDVKQVAERIANDVELEIATKETESEVIMRQCETLGNPRKRPMRRQGWR